MYDTLTHIIYFVVQEWMLEYDLTKCELVLLTYISSLSSLKNLFFLKKYTICEKLKISSRTFERAVKRLFELNLVITICDKGEVYYVSKINCVDEGLICQNKN